MERRRRRGPAADLAIRDSTGKYDTALYIIAGMLVVSCIIPLIVRPPAAARGEDREGTGRFTRKEEEAVGDRPAARSST